ncbi:MAG: hypothetical protein COS99_05055 [Candidatus Omnitrophica bacterium CG07_land_8_20_14_0_80_42_15]|uniref:Response regulatory domain-containing protein n=1 Tax=Candidatus Aquitaenariimonas noxiae TaxID=1974741 RepID=A0A2J0KSV6_9BACT|nr:MAG: hypothetical protein COS99_05055 [Candidatus Omnitrophica bacterium CG07_land_8_20_14_0_80_42_15]
MAHRIMVVDDEPEIVYLLGEFLAREGFEAIKCNGGKQALEIIKSGAPVDLIVLDGKMPEIDGPTVLAELKRMSCAIPVIMLTGSIDWNVRYKELLGKRCRKVLIKPIDFKILLQEIKKLLPAVS